MEANAANEDSMDSRLGFFTLINDYNVKMGWKFEETPDNLGIETVTTMVSLAIVREADL